ncbi:Nif3-like dinuclear metal center hexameric protein [Mycoplasmopsis sturni]|uniref:Nif3-like dinuclear metal center hexameric protein n=1 Tax=Mycoplasmopsis sturni TaxID=39047 RepID=UPI00056218A5|nr:Nif3-like dinuclear metal center hexameric protein [Mycoplasmopsis sturni]
MKIKDFIYFLESKYPLSNKEIWDPSGYSIKFNQAQKLSGVVFAIDVTHEVIDYAIENKCNLIVTHHPFWFEKTKDSEAIKAPYKFAIAKKAKEHKINIYAMHTNYDAHLYGTSYQILKYLGLANFFQYGSDKFSAELTKQTTFNELIDLIETKLKLSAFRTNFPKENFEAKISKIAFLSGSGYVGSINELAFRGFDLIISSDFKWSDWINFDQIGAKVLEIPHLDEQVFVYDMASQSQERFPDLEVHIKEIKVPYYNVY